MNTRDTRETDQKPCILIFAPESFAYQAMLDQVKLGVEEEGVPCRVELLAPGTATSADDYGNVAASASRLDVGVGFDNHGRAALNVGLMKKPLFYLEAGSAPADLRDLGCNAARLVKGMPLK